MSPVVSAIVILGVIGAVCALVLVIASKYFAVPVDEKFPAIRECLPGANCGACGYAGCDGYAQALASGEETVTNKCVPGASDAAKGIAAALGTEAMETVPQRAYVKCSGNCESAKKKYEYAGVNTCSAANILFSGEWACANSCLGYGDCEKVCPQEAIKVINGVAKVFPELCNGCGTCARQCPKKVIDIRKEVDKTIVRCSSKEKGAVVMKACATGCIGCMKCEKVCPVDAIKVTDNLATIDYTKCVGCVACSEACPKGVIQRLF